MRPGSRSVEPRLSRWLLGALVLHLGVLAAARFERAPVSAGSRVVKSDVEYDLDLTQPLDVAPPYTPTAPTPQVDAPAASPLHARLAASARAPLPADPESSPPEGAAPSVDATGSPSSSSSASSNVSLSPPPGHAIDLGLDGAFMRGAMLEHRFDRKPAKAAHAPSIGLLTEGLAQTDAAKGISRSSAAVSASYQSASAFGPTIGIALFDVQADASGAIISVSLVSEGPDQRRWQRVADDLRAQLSRRKLRIPQGAAGMLTRVRIERGQLAEDLGAMSRLERGEAVGQGALPPRAAADESTQSSLGTGLSPTLQVYSTKKSARATRVVIVSERIL